MKDVCRLINGRAYKKPELLSHGKYLVLRVGNFFTSKQWYYSDLELEADKYCDNGDLLYAWSASFGPRIWHGEKTIYHYHIWKVEHDKKVVEQRFLYYFFEWDKEKIMEEQGAGATMVHVSKTSMDARTISLPPLEEQKRIVAVLDAAFERLTRAAEHAEANLQNAQELFESGFEAQLENANVYMTTHTFGDDVILEIIDGDRGKAYPKKPDFTASGYCLFLSTKNVREDGFKFEECQFIAKEKDDELRKGKLHRRDVVLTTRGTIGNIGLFDEDVPFDQMRINSGMLILRPNEEFLLADYLFKALRSRVVRTQIQEQTSGAAQPQLPIRTLRELTLSIPKSLEDQVELVTGVQQHQEACQDLATYYRSKLTDIADLRQSLLQNAFAGELT